RDILISWLEFQLMAGVPDRVGCVSQAKKLKGTKRHFKFQVENCEVSVCPDLCVSRCMSPSLEKIAKG
ncbi:hypothetical protein, partial [Klebsiella pneumoniae]